MKRILFLGKNGYIGQKLYQSIKDYGQIYTLDSNIYLSETIKNAFIFYKPDFVINCVGYTGKPNVDGCESNKDTCYAFNTIFPGNLAATCAEFGAKLIHISSGCIFNGYNKVYSEEDLPNFGDTEESGSYYSYCKLQGEGEIIERGQDYYILRIRMPFDENLAEPKNYLHKLINYKKLINWPNSLTFLPDLFRFIKIILIDNVQTGIYHVTNPGTMTPKEIVRFLSIHGYINSEKKWFNSLEEFQKTVIAPRSNCILDSGKAGMISRIENVYKALYDMVSCKARKESL